MSGVTKHIYDNDIRDILCMWNKQLKKIYKTLPKEYTHTEIVEALKHYYPHEWFSVEIKKQYYSQKDKHLKNIIGKTRYNMLPIECLLKTASQYKILMDPKFRNNYSEYFSADVCNNARKTLWEQREPKIQRINQKIECAKSKVQQITPTYIAQLIGLYERKRTSQKDKLYILSELKKYYSPQIIQFFFKLNDTELNKQLRYEAFYHLQSFNYHPRLRKQKYMQIHTKNKKRKEYLKKVYPNETFSIPQTPDELEYRIYNSKEQELKKYDFFISHSYKDSDSVQKLIKYENSLGYDVFCDWINDSDYLKRNLLCSATLRIIEKRLEQSDALIFVESEHSFASVWCKHELNYFYSLGKPIYTLSAMDIENGNFATTLVENNWFVDSEYRTLIAFKGKK